MPRENQIWQREECLPRAELKTLQAERLRETVARASKVPFYREKFAALGITPEKIKSADDVRRLPFTMKSDLRDHYPLGFLAVEREKIARIHGSSGTTGKPTFVAYTRDDLDTWANLCARFLTAGGMRESDLCHISFGFGLFTGGFGLFNGIQKVGAGIIPAAVGNTPRHILLIQDLQPNTLIGTPSYALHIAETAKQQGVDPRKLSIRFGHFGAEPWTEEMRIALEAAFDLEAYNNYGLSEVIGPGVSGECYARAGMHVWEDHFIVECINPETLEPVEEGQWGELVFTSLTKQAFPIIRYRTRDISMLDYSPCRCGRTGVRMSRIKGRTDDMLIIRGVNVFPSQIEEALLRVEGVAPQYLIEVSRPHNLDEIAVKVEMRPEFFSDEMRQMQAMREKISAAIMSITGLHIKVELVSPQSLPRTEGKAKRVLDRRGVSA